MSRSALRNVDWNNPLHFVSVCWPQRSLYDKQREVLISVRDNVETFVHAANETGKSFVAAATAIWFICSRDPSITILSSSTQSQLESVLWSEIRRLVIDSKIDLPLDVQHLKINKLNRQGERIPRNFRQPWQLPTHCCLLVHSYPLPAGPSLNARNQKSSATVVGTRHQPAGNSATLLCHRAGKSATLCDYLSSPFTH